MTTPTILNLIEAGKTNAEIITDMNALTEANETSWYYLKVEQAAGTVIAETIGQLLKAASQLTVLPDGSPAPVIKFQGALEAYLDSRGIVLHTAERQGLIQLLGTGLGFTQEQIDAVKNLGKTSPAMLQIGEVVTDSVVEQYRTQFTSIQKNAWFLTEIENIVRPLQSIEAMKTKLAEIVAGF